MHEPTDSFCNSLPCSKSIIQGLAVGLESSDATLCSGLDHIVRLVFESAWYEDEGRNSYDEMQKIEHDCGLKRSRSERVQTIGEQKYATTDSPPFVCIVGHRFQ